MSLDGVVRDAVGGPTAKLLLLRESELARTKPTLLFSPPVRPGPGIVEVTPPARELRLILDPAGSKRPRSNFEAAIAPHPPSLLLSPGLLLLSSVRSTRSAGSHERPGSEGGSSGGVLLTTGALEAADDEDGVGGGEKNERMLLLFTSFPLLLVAPRPLGGIFG